MNVDLQRELFGEGVASLVSGVVLAVALFVLTFVSYAVGVFQVSGGVVFVAWDAAIVGAIGAAWVGIRRDGLAYAWLVTLAALYGARADHVFLGLSGRTLREQFGLLLRLDAFVYLFGQAVAIGTLAFVVGVLGQWAWATTRSETKP